MNYNLSIYLSIQVTQIKRSQTWLPRLWFQIFFILIPYLGEKWTQFDLCIFFQWVGWNHQLEWVVNRSRSFQICHRFGGENRFAPTNRQGGAKVFSEAVVAGPSFGTLQVGNFRGERSTERWGEWFHWFQAGMIWHAVETEVIKIVMDTVCCRWNSWLNLVFAKWFSLAFRECYLLAFLNSTLAVNQGKMFLKVILKCCQRAVNNSSDSYHVQTCPNQDGAAQYTEHIVIYK